MLLEKPVLAAIPAIEHWLRNQWLQHQAPFYASVDLRNSGYKIAPVDTNLFPGGFNNLNPDFLPLCIQAAMTAVEKLCPDAKNVLLIPENHTRNKFYLQNVAVLSYVLRQAGLNVRIGTLLPEITQAIEIELPEGGKLLLETRLEDIRLNFRMVTASGESAEVVTAPNLISKRRADQFHRYLVSREADDFVIRLRAQGMTILEVSPVNLGEVFLGLAGKELPCISGNPGTTRATA